MSRFGAYFLACIAFAIAIFTYQEFLYIGFPDGFQTDWDKTRKILLISFTGLSFLVSVWFVFLGRLSRQKRIFIQLSVTTILYVIVLVATFAVNHHLNGLSGAGG